MNIVHLHTAVATAAIVVASTGMTSATPVSTPVPTYNGDPDPSGLEAVFSGGPFVLPGVGTFDTAITSDYQLLSIGTPDGPNETFDYSATFTVLFTNPSSTGNFPGPFELEVVGRSSLFQTGTFPLKILSGSYSPAVINGQTVVRATSPGSATTPQFNVTYTAGGPSGLLVSTLATDLPIGFTVNGGAFISTPMGLTTQPAPSAVPLPAALPLFGGGLALVGWLARRRKAPAAPVAA